MEREGEPKEDATAREDDGDSKKLRDYYAKYNISLDALKEGNTSHRFIRLHPAFSWDDTLQKLKVRIVGRVLATPNIHHNLHLKLVLSLLV